MQTSETYLNHEMSLRNMDDDLKLHETNLLITIRKSVIFLLLALYCYTKTLKKKKVYSATKEIQMPQIRMIC